MPITSLFIELVGGEMVSYIQDVLTFTKLVIKIRKNHNLFGAAVTGQSNASLTS